MKDREPFFACQFCNEVIKGSLLETHEDNCYFNKKVRACDTCVNMIMTFPERWPPKRVCNKGEKLWKKNCESWKEK